jgi:tetratricopeptide (TPR) repeat protein
LRSGPPEWKAIMTRKARFGISGSYLAVLFVAPQLLAYQHQAGGGHTSSFQPLNAHVGSPQPAGHFVTGAANAVAGHVGAAHATGGFLGSLHSAAGSPATARRSGTSSAQTSQPNVATAGVRPLIPIAQSTVAGSWSGASFPNAGRRWEGDVVSGPSSWGKPYWTYHRDWVRGYWKGQAFAWGGNASWGKEFWMLSVLSGVAPGNLGPWGINPYAYAWGYPSYANPFLPLTRPAETAGYYDYRQPLDLVSRPAFESAAAPAVAKFDAAREAFRLGEYAQALSLIDDVIRGLPNDADAHEFRGVILFALGRYDEAATALYAVLAAGPGWDWPTLASVYPTLDPYTRQLRALETACKEHPEKPGPLMVLGYLYACQGANEAAEREFGRVATLFPGDQVVARLARTANAPAVPPDPTPSPEGPFPPPPFRMLGTWTATLATGKTVRLEVHPDESFLWRLENQDLAKAIRGRAAFQNDVLGLFRTDGPPLAGKVTWREDRSFNFKLVGNGAEDPGLDFSK